MGRHFVGLWSHACHIADLVPTHQPYVITGVGEMVDAFDLRSGLVWVQHRFPQAFDFFNELLAPLLSEELVAAKGVVAPGTLQSIVGWGRVCGSCF